MDAISASLSPALNLLLTLARASLGTADRSAINEINQGKDVDWEVFLRLAAHHRLDALLYSGLNAESKALLPATIEQRLREKHKMNVLAHLGLASSAVQIFREFEKQDIPALYLKGLAVEDWLYGMAGLRPAGDIDLYIDPSSLPVAMNSLKELGYDLAWLPERLTAGSHLAKQHLRSFKDHIFIHPNKHTVVELHWRLSRIHTAFPLDFDDAWHRRGTFNLAGEALSTLSRDTHAVYLCFHGAQHYFARLFWLYDIARLLLKEDTDWDQVLYQAKVLKVEPSLGVSVVMASEIFNAPIPAALAHQQSLLETGKNLSSLIIGEILRDDPTLPRPAPEKASFAYARYKVDWNSRLHPSKYHYLSQWIFELFSPTYDEWKSLSLPDSLTPLYRLWRPLRLASKLLLRS